MTRRIWEYARDHPNEQAVRDFLGYQKAFGNSRKTAHGAQQSYRECYKALKSAVLDGMPFVAGTAFVANGVGRLEFGADVIVFDKAGQSNEIDTLMALWQFRHVELLVLAGDTFQLGPVVISATASCNPLGNVLDRSFMARVL